MAMGYAIGGSLCCASGLSARTDGRDGRAWLVAAGLLLLIGINTVVRLDLLAIYFLREISRADGWYGRRREWQFLAIGTLGVAGMLALAWFRTRRRAAGWQWRGAFMGVSLLAGVAALRAISFHDIDLLLGVRLAGITAGRMLELAGLGLAATGALLSARAA
jgi:hypothetical protein